MLEGYPPTQCSPLHVGTKTGGSPPCTTVVVIILPMVQYTPFGKFWMLNLGVDSFVGPER